MSLSARNFSLLVVMLFVSACSRTTQAASRESLYPVLRSMVIDSVISGGRAPGDVFVAVDSSSRLLLRNVGVPLDTSIRSTQLTCPGSTDKDGRRPVGIHGYKVRLTVEGTGDTLQVSVFKACAFVYRGRPRGFYQQIDYEVTLQSGRWRARGIRLSIT